METRIKSLFLSDVHLGVTENNAQAAIDIIDKYEFDNLFLVGDIIDIKELRKKWRWKLLDTQLIHKIIKIANKKNVIYITGNHERGFFDDLPDSGLPIKFYREFIYNNKLIIHGDQFDTIIGNWRWIYSLGDWGYNLSIRLTYWINSIRRLFGLKGECKLSKNLKKWVKDSVNYLSNYHVAAAEYAKFHKCNTVICGHTHQREMRNIDGVLYVNCGDLRQDKTYVIETLEGELQSIDLEKDGILRSTEYYHYR
jgi:UDP-2,3-diacylglucosamine pyrophosphatase LpxH